MKIYKDNNGELTFANDFTLKGLSFISPHEIIKINVIENKLKDLLIFYIKVKIKDFFESTNRVNYYFIKDNSVFKIVKITENFSFKPKEMKRVDEYELIFDENKKAILKALERHNRKYIHLLSLINFDSLIKDIIELYEKITKR